MSNHDFTVFQGLLTRLRDNVPGFKTELTTTQTGLCRLIWEHGLKSRCHKFHGNGYMSISYQELDKLFGRRKWSGINARLNLFDVIPTWSKDKHYTRAFKLKPAIAKLKADYIQWAIRYGPEKLVNQVGQVMRTLPGAIASRNNGNQLSKFWVDVNLTNKTPVDRQALKQALKQWKELRGNIKSGNQELFCQRSIDEIDREIAAIKAALVESNINLCPGAIHHRYKQSNTGRLYAGKLQGWPRRVRQIAQNGKIDIDIENAHYSIIYQWARSLNLECKIIGHYLDNKKLVRESLADRIGITVDQSKKCLLMLIYGARKSLSAQAAIVDCVGKDKAQVLYQDSFFSKLLIEVRQARRLIIDSCPVSRGKIQNMAQQWIVATEPSERILAHLVQGVESVMLKTSITPIIDQTELAQHDGFTVANMVNCLPLIEAVRQVTGFNIGLSQDLIQVSI